MRVRGMTRDDVPMMRKLHETFYPHLEFPDFFNGFYAAFVIEDDDHTPIIGGGVEMVGEAVLVTDKDKTEIQIGRALVEAQKAALFVGKKFGLNEIIAFINGNDTYGEHLVQHGFYRRSSAYGLKVPYGER